MNKHICFQQIFLLRLLLQGMAYRIQARSATDEIQLMQSLWCMEKKKLIRGYMQLNEGENAAFWKVYDAYAAASKQLGADLINILLDYAQNYNNLTEEKADELIKRLMKIEPKLDKLQNKYYVKLKKATSAMKASQFMQLENYLQTTIHSELQNVIPFIGDLRH